MWQTFCLIMKSEINSLSIECLVFYILFNSSKMLNQFSKDELFLRHWVCFILLLEAFFFDPPLWNDFHANIFFFSKTENSKLSYNTTRRLNENYPRRSLNFSIFFLSFFVVLGSSFYLCCIFVCVLYMRCGGFFF